MDVTKACLLQVKAFGDLVIANAAARRVIEADRHRLTLAIGRHLIPLCDAIAPPVEVIPLATTESGVPAIFDVRRHGALSAIASGRQVKRTIARAPITPDTQILVDRLAWRERFLIGARPATGMHPEAQNIYDGYDRLLRESGFGLSKETRPSRRDHGSVGIFPGSRIAAKNLPKDLVAALIRDAARRGISTRLFLLDGERPDLEESGLPHIVVPRQFSALRDAIATNDVIISADSLPAHLAEDLGIDVFVLTPRPNKFWMPRSVFAGGHWCLFDDPDYLGRAASFVSTGDV